MYRNVLASDVDVLVVSRWIVLPIQLKKLLKELTQGSKGYSYRYEHDKSEIGYVY